MTVETMTDDDRWAAVLRRDRALDGRFVTGVLTTGIYCRPSCAARHPHRDNIRFFADGAAARATGLRPCKRCLPDDVARDEGAVLAAIAAIKSSEEPLALADLAARTGYSPTHFQRVFTRHTGLSPAAYARALREERARQALSDGTRVTDAIYDAGFSGPSRFYRNMEGRMGMTASAWVNGGKGATTGKVVDAGFLADNTAWREQRRECEGGDQRHALHGHDRRGIGADGEEADMAEVHQARQPVLQREAERQQDVDRPDDGNGDEIGFHQRTPSSRPSKPRGRTSSTASITAKASAIL